MNIKRTIFLVACLAAATSLTTGCNTVEGFGQDLKKGSAKVSEVIGKAGDKLSETANHVGGNEAAAPEGSAAPAAGETPAAP